MLAAERAAVGRRLAVLGSADGPPARLRKRGLGHRTKDCSAASGIVAAVDEAARRISLETDKHRITGQLRLPPDGYRSRLSDYLNSNERVFIPLTDVVITRLDGQGVEERHAFVAVSTEHVVMAIPFDEVD